MTSGWQVAIKDFYQKHDDRIKRDIRIWESLPGVYKYWRRGYRRHIPKNPIGNDWVPGVPAGWGVTHPLRPAVSVNYKDFRELPGIWSDVTSMGFTVGGRNYNVRDLLIPIWIDPQHSFEENPVRWIMGFSFGRTGSVIGHTRGGRPGSYVGGQIGQNIGYGIYDAVKYGPGIARDKAQNAESYVTGIPGRVNRYFTETTGEGQDNFATDIAGKNPDHPGFLGQGVKMIMDVPGEIMGSIRSARDYIRRFPN